MIAKAMAISASGAVPELRRAHHRRAGVVGGGSGSECGPDDATATDARRRSSGRACRHAIRRTRTRCQRRSRTRARSHRRGRARARPARRPSMVRSRPTTASRAATRGSRAAATAPSRSRTSTRATARSSTAIASRPPRPAHRRRAEDRRRPSSSRRCRRRRRRAPPRWSPRPGNPGARLALRLELDPDAGELIVAIENGATVRIVRGSDGWHVESS